jgi:hypothetical protein
METTQQQTHRPSHTRAYFPSIINLAAMRASLRTPNDLQPSSSMTAPVHKPWALRSIFTRSKDAKNVHTPQCGDIIQLDGFGGSFELTDGHNATLEDLVNISVGGVVLFTYPKANTPGCKCCANTEQLFAKFSGVPIAPPMLLS